MRNRWAPAFTVVELVIVIVVIAIVSSIAGLSYAAIQKNALEKALQGDLTRTAAEMKRLYQQQGTYPTTFPNSIQPSSDQIKLVLKNSVSYPYYSGLSNVQNGVLFAQICSDLISEGLGKGIDQGGTTRDYITGCGNWNHNSVQISGWDTQTWPTPVTSTQLTNYADTYTVSDTYHKSAQEATVKNFYNQLVTRLVDQGGSYPIASFWDYWATPSNGGVQNQPLATNPEHRAFYCVEAIINDDGESIWHTDQSSQIKTGACS